MLRPLATQLSRLRTSALSSRCSRCDPGRLSFSTKSSTLDDDDQPSAGVSPEDMPFFHFRKRERVNPKFKSPRKRASKLFDELNKETVQKNVERNPSVLKVPFRVGDAIEIEMVSQGGINSNDKERIRGVVLGKVNRGLGTSVYLRDVVFGEPVDRKIPLHSPLLKSLKVLEENFVFKGKRKVKRAKLYYLRDRLPIETRVTKW